MKQKNLLTIVIAALLVVIFVLLLFTFQVRQSEVVVVSTFLKPTATITNAGFAVKWPWPIQSLTRFDQRVQNIEDKYSPNTTSDKTPIMASVYAGWRISDAGQFMRVFKDGSVAAAQRNLEGILRSTKLAIIGKHDFSEFVNADPSQLKLAEIETNILQAAQAELAKNNYGISLEFVGFKKLGLPESVTQAVFDRMKAERTILISKAQFEGESEAAKIRSSAELKAALVLADAQAAATRIKGEGEAEAAKTLTVFQQNPDLANFLLGLEALKNSANKNTTLIFDERQSPFNLFQGMPANSTAK